MEVVGLFGLWETQQCQMCREAGGHGCKQYGPSEGLFFAPGGRCVRTSPRRAFSIVHQQILAYGEREATVMAPPPACDSAVAPCFHGSLVFLRRHFLLQISSLPPPQFVSLQQTAVLAPGLLSNPYTPFPSHLAHQ